MSLSIYTYSPPPNGPTAGGIRVLARSREQQQNKKLTKTKNQKNKKTKKTKKTIFSKTMGLGPPKDGFFGFLEKKMVFLVRNHLFLEKMMVFGGLLLVKPSFSREKDGFWRSSPGRTIFFSRKRWFRTKKPSFSRENQKNQKNKKTIFWRPQPHSFGKDVFFVFLVFLVFSRKRWFFGAKPSFSREKDVFWRSSPGKTIFFSRKRWFRTKKPSFSRENQKNKKTKKIQNNHLLEAPAP